MSEPRRPHRGWKVGLVSCLLALPSLVLAAPKPGEPLPSFTGEDLLGQKHASAEYAGHPTLLVVITDKNAGDRMREWFDAADQHAPSVQTKSIISLHLPFFAGINTVRGRVKPKVPRENWDDTLLDRDGTMAGVLELESSKQPYVFALDANGQVVARVHGNADSPQAQRIWSALTPPQAPGSP
jgi:hypothetical protein